MSKLEKEQVKAKKTLDKSGIQPRLPTALKPPQQALPAIENKWNN